MGSLGRSLGERPPHQHAQPITAVSQPLQQRHVGNVGEPDRCGPSRCQSQAFVTETIGQDHAQEIDGGFETARTSERAGFAGVSSDDGGAAEATNQLWPVAAEERIMSHPLQNHIRVQSANFLC